MPRDDVPETDEYGQLVNPGETAGEDADVEDLGDLETLDWSPPSRDELEVEVNSWDNRINQYQTAAKHLGISPDLVYEPANGADISTAQAFPGSDVLYAEVAEHNTEAVKDAGYNVVLADAEELALSEEPDLVVFRNSAMDETRALENNPSEYVFANDWLGSAENIADTDDYNMVGIVPQNETYFQEADSIDAGETADDLYVFQRSE